MRRKLLLLMGLIGLVLTLMGGAKAAPIELSAPWKKGEIWIAGSGCWAGGSYFRQGHHLGKDRYAVDVNGVFSADCNLLENDDGKEILATNSGKVTKIGRNPYSGYGYYVVLDHGSGVTSRYAHLKYDPTEKPGLRIDQSITRGETVGLNGTTGSSTAPHLHFVLYQDDQSIPPSPMEDKQLCDSCSGTLVVSYNERSNLVPNQAKLQHPLNNSMSNDRIINFIWEDGGDPDNYPRNQRNYYLIIKNATGQEVLHTDWMNQTQYSWTSFDYGQYYWSVISGDGDQVSQSITRTFFINQPPQAPTLLSPSQHSASRDRTVKFTWEDSGDDNQPRSYRNFVVKIYRNTGAFIQDSDWRLFDNWSTTLTPGNYQWEVCAGDGALVTCSGKQDFRVRQRAPIDFNADGVSDSLAHNRSTGQVNHDLYREIWPRTIAQSNWSGRWQHYFGYFNNDNYADKLSYIPETGEAAMMTANQAGLLKTVWQTSWQANWDLTIGDFNGDGRDDLIAYNKSNGNIELALARADGTFGSIWRNSWGVNWDIYTGDFNGDSKAELLTYNYNTGVIHQYRVNDSNELELNWQTNWLSGWEIHSGDFDDDGYDDLLAYNPISGQANLGISQGINAKFSSFHPPFWPTVWSPGWEISIGNFDGHGPIDALFYSKNTGQAAMDVFNENGDKWFRTIWSTYWSRGWDFNR